MTSYICDKIERFGNCISINIMYLSVCNAKEFCYIAPDIKNEVGKTNIVCEGFLISKTHDAYKLVLDSFFKMCLLRNKHQVFAIFSNQFMTKSILDSIGMYDTFMFYDHFHLKMNLEKSLLSKWKILKPYIDLTFTTSVEELLISFYEQSIDMCKDSNSSEMFF